MEEERYALPPMMQTHATEGSLQFQLDVVELLEDLEHNIRGEIEVYDPKLEKRVWKLPKGMKPLINNIGVNSVMTIMRPMLSKIFILSDFEKEDVEDMTVKLGKNIIDDFYFNWNNYKIKDTAVASTILHLCTDAVYATLRKGFKRNYLKFLSTITNVQEMQHRAIQEKQQQQAGAEGIDPINFIFGKRKR